MEQRRLKEKMKEFNKKEAKFYGNMFAKLSVSISLILPAHFFFILSVINRTLFG